MSIPHSPNSETKEKTAEVKNGTQMKSKNEHSPFSEKACLKAPEIPKPLTARSRKSDVGRGSSPLEENLQVTEKLYIFGAKLDNFRTVGPWHPVDGKYMHKLVNRLATPVLRPCSRGHSVGARYSEDNQYYSYAMSRPDTGYSSAAPTVQYGRSTALSSRCYSAAPRKSVKNERDYAYDSWSTTPTEQSLKSVNLNGIVNRVTRPTVSSRGGVDIAEKYENKDYVYGSLNVTPTDLNEIVTRVTRPTVASTGGAGIQRKYTDFVYGDKAVSRDEYSEIIDRLTTPTVASEGGAPLATKPFIYKTPPITKTNPKIPGFAKKQQRLRKTRKVTASELEEIVNRLNTLTPAYKAKYSPSPHVWVDDAPRGPAFQQQVAAA